MGEQTGNWGVAGALGKGTGADARRTVSRLEAVVAVGARGRLTPAPAFCAGTRAGMMGRWWGRWGRRAKRGQGGWGKDGGEREKERDGDKAVGGGEAGMEEARPSWAGEAKSVKGSAADLE